MGAGCVCGAVDSTGWERVGGALLALFLLGAAARSWRLDVVVNPSGALVINETPAGAPNAGAPAATLGGT